MYAQVVVARCIFHIQIYLVEFSTEKMLFLERKTQLFSSHVAERM